MEENQTNKFNMKREIVEWLEAIFIAMSVAIFVLIFLVRIVVVDGKSMLPTLKNGDKLVTSSLFYQVEFDDIVVIKRNHDKPIIKRVIATEGQTVDIDFVRGEVFVDGKKLDEPFINEPTTNSAGNEGITFPATVPKDCVFVLGDNRNDSLDSRYQQIGMINKDHIFGEVLFRMTPFSAFGEVR